MLFSCNHSGVVEKRVRLVAGGSFCCVGVVTGGCEEAPGVVFVVMRDAKIGGAYRGVRKAGVEGQ